MDPPPSKLDKTSRSSQIQAKIQSVVVQFLVAEELGVLSDFERGSKIPKYTIAGPFMYKKNSDNKVISLLQKKLKNATENFRVVKCYDPYLLQ